MRAQGLQAHEFNGGDVGRVWFEALEPALRASPGTALIGLTAHAPLECLQVMAMARRRATLLRIDHYCLEDRIEYRLHMDPRYIPAFESQLLASGHGSAGYFALWRQRRDHRLGSLRCCIACVAGGQPRCGKTRLPGSLRRRAPLDERGTAMTLPPGVTAHQFSAAIMKFKGALGSEWVFTSDEDLYLYRDAYSPFWGEPEERLASAAVAPQSTEEVQAAVRIANEYRIPISRNFDRQESRLRWLRAYLHRFDCAGSAPDEPDSRGQ